MLSDTPTKLIAQDAAVFDAVSEQLERSREASELFVRHVPIAYARRHLMMLREGNDDTRSLVSASILPDGVVDAVARLLPIPFEIECIEPGDGSDEYMLTLINSAYRQWGGNEAASLIQPRERERLSQSESLEDLLDDVGRAPVVQIVNALLLEAARLNASDIHIDPTAQHVLVRMRIDGVLEDRHHLPLAIRDETISRVKVMARMNVAEKRLPQDGRISVEIGAKTVDLRIASLPNVHGERLVIRLLDASEMVHSLGELQMNAETLARYQGLVSRPNGILLVTGPTGSGKTTTLYATLQLLNKPGRNIITIEDPVEYKVHGVSQTQINERAGLTFSQGLRSVLRQDPDIIMLGEIRDHDTAVMAMQASLTGHLVLSTLHTNNAASSVTRLLDLGVEPYLVASSLIGVMAQRLLRQLCPRCKELHAPTESENQWLGEPQDSALVARSIGCQHCRHTGYEGRRGIFELLEINTSIREAIGQSEGAETLSALGIANGMKSLRSEAVQAVLGHSTSITEAERVTLGIGV